MFHVTPKSYLVSPIVGTCYLKTAAMMNESGGSGVLASLFQNCRVNAIIHMDRTGTILSVNAAFTHYFGWTNTDAKGNSFSMLFTPEDNALHRPAQELNRLLANGQADDKNYLMHKDGSCSWVSGESVVVKDENGREQLLKIIQDISGEKQSEASLSRMDAFNEHILNAIDDFVIVLDKSLRLVKFNPAFAKLFRSGEPPQIDDFGQFIAPYDTRAELINKIEQVTHKGGSFRRHLIEISTPRGKRFFDISCQLLEVESSEKDILLVGRDITVQKTIEEEREDLIGFVAHELRNPLTALQLRSDIIARMVEENELAQLPALLEQAKMNIARLMSMTAGLYDATKIAGDGIRIKEQNFDFDAMINDTIGTFRLLHPARTLILEGQTGLTYKGDSYRLSQVLENYLSNAAKYSKTDTPITIKVFATPEAVTVAVTDKGPGIAANQLPFIFDRFYRANKAKNLEGIGLGLFLCRKIIEAHRGQLWAESQEGVGSIFYFRLPIPVR